MRVGRGASSSFTISCRGERNMARSSGSRARSSSRDALLSLLEREERGERDRESLLTINK